MDKIYNGIVTGYTHDGRGVVKDHHLAFIRGALKDETVEYTLTRTGKKFNQGKVTNVLTKSKNRTVPPCPYINECGGCHVQHMNDLEERDFKREAVFNTLRRHIKDIKVSDTVELDDLYYYRNKTVFAVREQSGNVVIGQFHKNGKDVVDIDHCMIQKHSHNEIIKVLRKLIVKHNISIYNEDLHRGFLRHLIIRSNHDDSEIQVIFVTNGKEYSFKPLVNELVKDERITSVIQNIHTEKTNLVTSFESVVRYGNEFIEDELLSRKFKVKDLSFYQVNHEITEKMYNEAIERAELKETDVVIDAYSGIGTIGQLLSQNVKEVIGIEVVESAVEDAKDNAELNNIKNASYVLGKAEDKIKEIVKEKTINTLFIDPPRKGADKVFLDTILEVEPEKIVYISCNPATLGRDLKILSEKYNVGRVTPYNMFSKTYHVECVVSLSKK